MGKILSSRDDPTDLESMQDLVAFAHDALEFDEEPADTVEELATQIELAVLGMGDRLRDQSVQIAMLSMDLIELSIRSAGMAKDLRDAVKLIEALAEPVHDTDAFKKALLIMKREGDPTITTRANDDHGIEVDVDITFEENDLEEALRLAIGEYITSTAEAALK